MNFKTTKDFDREAKRLAKKYHSLAKDIRELREDLLENPTQGDALGDNCYKVRMPISSKNKGKSGGARVITCVKIIEDTIHLLYIFDKSEMDNISDAFLKELIKTT
jgi:hypothetical protein